MNDFLNFSLNSLNLLDNQIHDNIKGSFVDDFIHELQNYLELQTSNTLLENLPKNTNLHFAKFEDNYAVCFDYSSKTIYNIPKSYLKGTSPEIGVDFAVCKNLNTNKTENIQIDDVPTNAKDGDTLVFKDGNFVIKN